MDEFRCLGDFLYFVSDLHRFIKQETVMRSISHIASFGLICLFVFAASCKKSPSEFNLTNPGITASLDGSTAQYLVPSGLVNATSYYSMSGYESSASANTVLLTIDTAATGTYPFNKTGNSLIVINNGITYSSANNHGLTAGSASVTINGNSVSGTFSGTVYGAGVNYKDSLVVTSGTISTSY